MACFFLGGGGLHMYADPLHNNVLVGSHVRGSESSPWLRDRTHPTFLHTDPGVWATKPMGDCPKANHFTGSMGFKLKSAISKPWSHVTQGPKKCLKGCWATTWWSRYLDWVSSGIHWGSPPTTSLYGSKGTTRWKLQERFMSSHWEPSVCQCTSVKSTGIKAEVAPFSWRRTNFLKFPEAPWLVNHPVVDGSRQAHGECPDVDGGQL